MHESPPAFPGGDMALPHLLLCSHWEFPSSAPFRVSGAEHQDFSSNGRSQCCVSTSSVQLHSGHFLCPGHFSSRVQHSYGTVLQGTAFWLRQIGWNKGKQGRNSCWWWKNSEMRWARKVYAPDRTRLTCTPLIPCCQDKSNTLAEVTATWRLL